MKKRYSSFIVPIVIMIDLLIINSTMFIISPKLYATLSHMLYMNIGWLLISFYVKFYTVHRYTKQVKILSLLVKQLGLFFLVYFSYFGVFKEGITFGKQTITLVVIYTGIVIFKIFFIAVLRKYRVEGNNYRNVVVLGGDQSIASITRLFDENVSFGYRYKGYFSNVNLDNDRFLGATKESFEYILSNDIDEIYCSISEFSQSELKEIIDFGDENHKLIKLVPDSKGIFNKGLVLEYYDYIPVLTMKDLPFDDPVIKYSKRFFDVIFSLFVIVFILSWLSCILFILIKLESKGPLIFKQSRDGLNGEKFDCYKFRSMNPNKDSEIIQTAKEDVRITRVGKFIRKTSIDEFPQFINVLIGDMSVVGPRPHMTSQSKKFSKIVNKYFVRNLVKPGITGLAQSRGCRGEIEKIKDIEDRVRLDIFYINKWSFLLDIKIIIQTVLNAFKGEAKAY